jgi:hypothetical protein
MSTNLQANSTAVFELVRFVDGRAVPYQPYRSDCSGCCSTSAATESSGSCCGGR